jgi:3-oxoacyl-[acyl-carrier protein] reductase
VLFRSEELLKQAQAGVPIRRFARPDELAAMVAFLASERAGSINGTSIAIDGGFIKGLL